MTFTTDIAKNQIKIIKNEAKKMDEGHDVNGPHTPGWAIILILLTVAISFGVLLSTRERFIAHAAETVSQDSVQPIQPQIDELRQRVDELQSRVDSLVHNRLPEKIEFCGERVPLERGYVRERLDKELIFMSRKQFALYIKRAEKYFPYIEKRLKERKMPDCLKYIAVIESALLPHALSSAKAYGPWQFIPSTAARYGLKRGLNYDERANFEKATDAALSYLWDNCILFKKLGVRQWLGVRQCWILAMAAYNAGESRVKGAVRQQKTFNYFDLWLPAETMQYVYRAIIAQLVMSNPEQFGFSLKDSDLYHWPQTREVKVVLKKPRSIVDIALSYKTSLNEFLWLNPQIKMNRKLKDKSSLPKGTYKFKIPTRD